MDSCKSIIVGGGAVGADFHAPRLLGIAGCKDLTIVDSSSNQREVLRAKFSRDPRVTIASKIPQNNFDLAVVATPPKYHLGCFSDLKHVCKNIVIEKPLTKTLEEAIQLNSMAEEFGVKTYVGLIRRSLTNFALVKSWIQSQLFGDLRSVFVAEGMIFSWNAVSAGSFSRDLNGGGVLMDTGPHTLDQLFQVFDTLSVVSSKLDAVPAANGKSIEANATIELESEGRVPITVLFSRNRALSNVAKFEFERADVELGLHSNSVRITDRSGSGMYGIPNCEIADVNYMQMFDAYYRKFIRQRNNAGVSGPESVQLQTVIEEIYECAVPMERSF